MIILSTTASHRLVSVSESILVFLIQWLCISIAENCRMPSEIISYDSIDSKSLAVTVDSTKYNHFGSEQFDSL